MNDPIVVHQLACYFSSGSEIMTDEKIKDGLSKLRWICFDCFHVFPITDLKEDCPKCHGLKLDCSMLDEIESRIEEAKNWKKKHGIDKSSN